MTFHKQSVTAGWNDSFIREWLNKKFFNAFSAEWKQVLQNTIIYSLGDDNSTVTNNLTNNNLTKHFSRVSTADKLYIPAVAEIYPGSFGNSETKISLYEDELGPDKLTKQAYPGFIDDASRIKYLKNINTPEAWWTRTPSLDNLQTICFTTPQGDIVNTNYYFKPLEEGGSTYTPVHPASNPAGVLIAFSI
jgi:hypothetical protein